MLESVDSLINYRLIYKHFLILFRGIQYAVYPPSVTKIDTIRERGPCVGTACSLFEFNLNENGSSKNESIFQP